MLESLAKSINAYGCILWQVVPRSNLDGDKPSGYLFVLAEWFPDEKRDPLHNMPLEKSVTGTGVLNNSFVSVSDIKDSRVYDDPFLTEAGIQAFCSMPIKFRGGKRGAVNVYRREAIPFDSKDEERLKQLSSLIPEIYKAIRDKVNFSVLRRVHKILHRAELRAGGAPLTKSEVQTVIQKICKLVSNTFQCIETSIFLEDRLEAPGTYDLMATTWPQSAKKLKSRYRKSKDDGITGWILAEAKSVTIFDLHYFDRDRELILRDYPGLKWNDTRKIGDVVRQIRQLEENKPLPPLSFMGAPIVMGKEVLGAIRCSVAQEGPYYFADLALDLLRLVAAQISRYWSNWLGQREKQDEIVSWQELVKSLGELNSFVLVELSKEAPDEHRIFAEALRISQSVIRGAEIMDVRLIDERQPDELYYAQTAGDFWNDGSQEEIEQRKTRRFKLKEIKPTSAGAYVVQTGEVYLIPDVNDKKYVYAGTFADTKRLIVAPIKVADRIYGVLDIRGTSEAQFPRYAVEIAGLLGQQLGLYQFLAISTRRLRNTQAVLREKVSELSKTKLDLEMNINELKRFEAQQIQILENLQHQLKSPLIPALDRFQKLLRSAEPDSKLESDLLDIRGIFRRFRRVAMSTDLFASIAKGENFRIKPRLLECDSLVSTLIGYAKDSRLSVDPSRGIRFHVDEDSFAVLKTRMVQADTNLLEQAVMNLLDNAGKYSSNNTEVRIYGGITSGGRFHITIANKGLRIRSEDIPKCKTRGWRSEQAQATAGEGSGIGLWLVDHIMRSHHGGELEIKATTPDNVTEVRLLFSVSTEGKHNAHLIS